MKKLVLFVLLLSGIGIARSQEKLPCGTDEWEESLMKEDPTHAVKRSIAEALVDNNVKKGSSASRLLRNPCQKIVGDTVLPVVVHIVYVDGPSNVSDQSIKKMIDTMNYEWTGKKGGKNMGFTFALAKRDPNGNATTGINHINGAGIPNYATNGAQLAANDPINLAIMAAAPAWDKDKYINIWIVKSNVFSGAAGYLYRTIMIRYDNVVTSGVLTHEMGHFFDLYHTFQGSTSTNCPLNNNPYADGDKCPDTRPHKMAECVSTTCSGSGSATDVFANFMSYCGRQTMFTSDQKDRVMASLVTPERWCLVESDGILDPNVAQEVAIDSLGFVENLAEYLCNGIVTPKCKFDNLANTPITSIEGIVTIDAAQYSVYLPVVLQGGGSKTLPLGSFQLQDLVNHDVHIVVTKINGAPDARSFDNEICMDFTALIKTITVSATVIPSTMGIVTGTGQKSCAGSYQLIAPTAPKNSVFMGWYDDGGNLVTTDLVYPYTTDLSGDIHVTAKYSVTTGVTNSFAQSGFKLYPNPATSSVTLDFGSNGDYMVEIFNSLGQALLNEQVSNTHQKIVGTSEYAKGIYFVRVSDGENTVATEQFLINN